MRTLKLQMQVSLDGFVGGLNGEMDWMTWDWDEGLNNYVTNLTEPVDTILLGRKLAEGFIPYWSGKPGLPGAKKMNDTPKIVFSKTLQQVEWLNTKLAKGHVVDEIHELKKQKGKDIIVYGGATFVSNLIRLGLINDYHLFVNPVAVGKGLAIFHGLESKLDLKLVNSQSFNCGIVGLHYQPK